MGFKKEFEFMNIKTLSIGLLIFISFFIIGFYSDKLSTNLANEISFAQEKIAIIKSNEFVLIYIGSSKCVPSNTDRLVEDLKKIKNQVREQAENINYSFASLGIAKDWNLNDGLAHLAKYDSFDELFVGRSWNNTGLSRYIYDDNPGKAATPQIIMIKREYGSYGNESNVSYRGINSEEEIFRLVGIDEISKAIQENRILDQISFAN